ncbi:MAG: ABC transporter permease subunit [Clostridiales bacterium]|nr:ABC transporter permease subunit [Clostridiales bacterium]
MTAIWKKELHSYFYTPVGYVFMGVFLALAGLMFYILNIVPRSSNIPFFFGSITYLWIPMVPVITMRLFAEEKQKKTDQLIFTSPISITAVVIGKFLAASTLLFATVLLTGFYVLYVGMYAKVYVGGVMVAYTGFILQGISFVAINIFLSSVSKSPTTAAIASLGINFLLWIMKVLAQSVSNPWVAKVLSFFSIYDRYLPFEFGQLSFASIVYYLCFIVVFLSATVIHLQGRRWREA